MTVLGGGQLNDFNLDLRNALLVTEIQQARIFYKLAPLYGRDPAFIQFGFDPFQNLPIVDFTVRYAVVN